MEKKFYIEPKAKVNDSMIKWGLLADGTSSTGSYDKQDSGDGDGMDEDNNAKGFYFREY